MTKRERFEHLLSLINLAITTHETGHDVNTFITDDEIKYATNEITKITDNTPPNDLREWTKTYVAGLLSKVKEDDKHGE